MFVCKREKEILPVCACVYVRVSVCERESERRGNGAKRAFKNRFDGCSMVEGGRKLRVLIYRG